MVMEISLGDTARLKKGHPCGGYDWEVVRVGADIGLRCLKCNRRVIMSRSDLKKRLKSLTSVKV